MTDPQRKPIDTGPDIGPVLSDIKNTQRETLRRLEAVEKQQESISTILEKIMGAFPEGDVDGHCRYHQLMIERTEEVRRLRAAIQEKTISGLLWSFMVFVGVTIWHYLKAKL